MKLVELVFRPWDVLVDRVFDGLSFFVTKVLPAPKGDVAPAKSHIDDIKGIFQKDKTYTSETVAPTPAACQKGKADEGQTSNTALGVST